MGHKLVRNPPGTIYKITRKLVSGAWKLLVDCCCDGVTPVCYCWGKWEITYSCGGAAWGTATPVDSAVMTDPEAAAAGWTDDAGTWNPKTGFPCTKITTLKGSTATCGTSCTPTAPTAPTGEPDGCCPAPCCTSGDATDSTSKVRVAILGQTFCLSHFVTCGWLWTDTHGGVSVGTADPVQSVGLSTIAGFYQVNINDPGRGFLPLATFTKACPGSANGTYDWVSGSTEYGMTVDVALASACEPGDHS